MSFNYYESLQDLYQSNVPTYKSAKYKEFCGSYGWDPGLARKIWSISPRRGRNRVTSYIIPSELERVRRKLSGKKEASIRFGHEKKGHGIKGERGDFCLVGGRITRSQLTLFYRSLELIGGLHYDQCIILALEKLFKINFKTIKIFTDSAHVFALKGNSNEKLFIQLRKLYYSHQSGSNAIRDDTES